MASADGKTSPCGDADPLPRRPDNRAGLGRISYRITAQPEAVERMLRRLPRKALADPDTGDLRYPLGALRTRDLKDPTISLIDAYAMACDVLSFYSERVANEGYIGTATQRRSVRELARMIGYELAPGVAASTYLAFTVEDADDPYRVVEIGAGVQAMSIPHAKGKLPQTFETVEAITARAEWNDIHARTQRPQNLVLFDDLLDAGNTDNGTLYLFDLDNSFDAAALADPDLVTIHAEDELTPFHPLTRRLDLPAALAKRIEDKQTNDEVQPVLYALPVNEVCLAGLGLNLRKGTRMLAVGQAAADDAPVTALPLRVVSATEDRAFGLTKVVLTRSGQAPEKVRRAPRFRFPRLLVGILPAFREPLGTPAIETHVRGKTWSGDGLTALVQSQAWQRTKLMTLIRLLVLPPPEQDDGDEVALGLHVMRDSAGFFGSTAPLWDTLNYGAVDCMKDKGPYTHPWDGTKTGGTPNTIWMDALAANHIDNGAAHVYLDREITALAAQRLGHHRERQGRLARPSRDPCRDRIPRRLRHHRQDHRRRLQDRERRGPPPRRCRQQQHLQQLPVALVAGPCGQRIAPPVWRAADRGTAKGRRLGGARPPLSRPRTRTPRRALGRTQRCRGHHRARDAHHRPGAAYRWHHPAAARG
jgi:hypothetical protein